MLPHKSVGSDKMHPRVRSKLANVAAKTLNTILENPWQSSEVPRDWKKGNITPVFKTVKRILGTTNQ